MAFIWGIQYHQKEGLTDLTGWLNISVSYSQQAQWGNCLFTSQIFSRLAYLCFPLLLFVYEI